MKGREGGLKPGLSVSISAFVAGLANSMSTVWQICDMRQRQHAIHKEAPYQLFDVCQQVLEVNEGEFSFHMSVFGQVTARPTVAGSWSESCFISTKGGNAPLLRTKTLLDAEHITQRR